MYHCSWTFTPTISTLLGGAVEAGGDGTGMDSGTPVKVMGFPAKAVQLSVGTGDRIHSCVVLENGPAWCWGRNDFGQPGDGTMSQQLSPVQVKICR